MTFEIVNSAGIWQGSVNRWSAQLKAFMYTRTHSV